MRSGKLAETIFHIFLICRVSCAPVLLIHPLRHIRGYDIYLFLVSKLLFMLIFSIAMFGYVSRARLNGVGSSRFFCVLSARASERAGDNRRITFDDIQRSYRSLPFF